MGMTTPGTCQSGHAVLPGELFCPACGEYLRTAEEAEHADTQPLSPGDPPAYPADPYSNRGPYGPPWSSSPPGSYGYADPYDYPGPFGFPAPGAYPYPATSYGYPTAPYGYPSATYAPGSPSPSYPPPYRDPDPRYGALPTGGGTVPAGRQAATGAGAPAPYPPYGAPWLSPPHYGYHPYGYYPYGYPYYHRPATRPANSMAIASLILGIVWFWWLGSIAAVILGHAALAEIKRTGERGREAAIVGTVLGWIGVAVLVGVVAVGAASN